jgi:hypothetical protein
VRLVVGTSSCLIDLELDDRLRVTRETVVGRGHHYGIALLPGPGNVLLCKHNSGMDRYRAQGDAPLQRVDRRRSDGGVNKVHQIAYADGGVYLADTEHNSLVFQTTDGRCSKLHLHGHALDVDHINSVFPCASGVLTMLHNWYDRPSEVVLVEHGPDGGLRATAAICLPDRGCHNVFVDGRRLLYNASEAGTVVALDLVDREVERTVALGGHTKGLAATADHLIVGCSPHVKGKQRFTSKGGLVVLDRRSLAVLTRVELGRTCPVGNVNEVRALDGAEEAHAADTSLPSGFASFRLPEKRFGAGFRLAAVAARRAR